tara:strand:- start:1258 stop:1752 length:495 start_codon:yes stop_codon:yes gene_type:complete
MKWFFCKKIKKIHNVNIKKNTIDVLYHGTLTDFDPHKIKSPSWFSIEEDQSVKWIYYKYKKNKCQGVKTGYLHKFRVKSTPNLIDINENSDYRLEINANGNYKFSQKIINGEYGNYDGYINLEDQAELMLCNPSKFLEILETTKIQIEKVYDLNYQKTDKGWRL